MQIFSHRAEVVVLVVVGILLCVCFQLKGKRGPQDPLPVVWELAQLMCDVGHSCPNWPDELAGIRDEKSQVGMGRRGKGLSGGGMAVPVAGHRGSVLAGGHRFRKVPET